MRNILNLFLLLLVFSLPLSAQENTDGIKFITDQSYEAVLAKAKTENKIIFIDCFADWCGPCKTLSRDVFPLKKVGNLFNEHFINVKYNVEEGEGIHFAEKHSKDIPGLPTMLFINDDGEILHSVVGARSAEALIDEAKLVLDGKTFVNVERKYLAGDRSLDLVKDYVSALKSAYKNDEARKVVEDFMANLPVESLLDADIWEMSKMFIDNPYAPDFQFAVSNLHKLKDKEGLDRQLSRSIEQAVNGILPRFQDKSVTQATLDSVAVLKSVLRRNILDKSTEMLGKFEIAEFIRNDEPEKVSSFITFAHNLSLYRSEGKYLHKVFKYIAENTDNEQVLSESLTLLNNLQVKENSSYFTFNFYDIIALMNAKLGNVDEAEFAQAKFDELDAVEQKRMKKIKAIFGDNAK